ncbi:MAG: tetratricopeptide repeat protein [Candidatus Bathyarchaeia archaeon]
MSADQSLSTAKKEYAIFLCHEQITDCDFAEYLRDGFLRKCGIACFAFEFDMPKTIKPDAIEWRPIIDHVIATCHSFFIFITSNELSTEVVREFEQAMIRLKKDPKFSIAIFRHKKSVSRTSNSILSALKIDTSKFNQNDFESKEDLVRQALQLVDDKGFARELVSPPAELSHGSGARSDEDTAIPPQSGQEIILRRRYREGPLKEELVRFVGEKAIARYVDGMSRLISAQSDVGVNVIEAVQLMKENRYNEADIKASRAVEVIQNVDIKKRTVTLSQLYLIKGDAALNTGRFADAEKSYLKSHELALEAKDKFLSTASANGIGVSKGSRGDHIGALNIFTELDSSDNAAVWVNKGLALALLGRYDEALQAYDSSLSISRKLGDQAGLAGTLHNLGVIEHDRGNYDKAKQLYSDSLEINRQLGDQLGIAGTVHQLGMLEKDRGNFDEAKKLYDQSLEIARKLGNEYVLSKTLHELGTIEYLKGNYDDAKRLYNQSLGLSRKVGDQSGMAGTLAHLAMIEQHRGNYDEAKRIYNDILNTFKQLEDYLGMAKTLNQLGLIQADQGNYDEAVRLYNQALEMDRKFGDQFGTAALLGQIATIEQIRGNYDEAKRVYSDVLNTFKKLGNQSAVAATLHQLGTIEQKLEHYDQASRLFNQSLETRRQLGDQLGIANSLGQIATNELELGNFDKAEQLYNEAKEIFQQLGEQLGVATTLTGLGRVSEKRGNYDEAKTFYDQSLEIERKLGNRLGMAITLHNLGNTESQSGNYGDANRFYEESLSLSGQKHV